MRFLRKIQCLALSHKMNVVQELSSAEDKLQCARCGEYFILRRRIKSCRFLLAPGIGCEVWWDAREILPWTKAWQEMWDSLLNK